MDGIITDSAGRRHYPYLCFVILAAVTAVFIAAGIRYSRTAELFGEISFYGRYDGITGGVLTHIRTAAVCSASTLVQLMILYLMSFSPLLIPAGVTVIGCRGFIAGAAYCIAEGSAPLVHTVIYTATTAVICIAVAVLWHFGKCFAVLKKTAAFLVSAGTCVIFEILLSYMI